jgi:hypothetical protein
MTYLILMDRWKLSYSEVVSLPQHVVEDMILVMEAEHRVEQEPDIKRGY